LTATVQTATQRRRAADDGVEAVGQLQGDAVTGLDALVE